MMRRRRPLLRGAMVAGGAYAVGKHAQRNQQAEYDQEARISELEAQQSQQQYAAPPPPAPVQAAPQANTGDMVKQLQDLKTLKDQGILTDAEFEVQKAKILQGL
jgi:putative oligomerization/nucleic acid binding protein